MKSVGQPLKAARESKHMTVSNVASETRLQSQLISAIERDDFSSAPAPIYARGFIRLYAECVGIDPAPLIRTYNDYHAPGARVKTQDNAKTPTEVVIPSAILASVRGRICREETPETGKRRFRLQLPKLKAILLTRIHMPRYRIPRTSFRAFSGMRWPRLNITKIEAAMRSGIQGLWLKLPKLQAPHLHLSAETWQKTVSVAAALILVIAAVGGLLWYSGKNQPRLSESHRIQEPPTPYLDSFIKGERSL